MLEAIITEYKPAVIKPFSKNIAIMTILVLNFTDSPIPNKIESFLPNLFFPLKKLAKILAARLTNTIKIINNGKVIRYVKSIDTPIIRKKMGAKKP